MTFAHTCGCHPQKPCDLAEHIWQLTIAAEWAFRHKETLELRREVVELRKLLRFHMESTLVQQRDVEGEMSVTGTGG